LAVDQKKKPGVAFWATVVVVVALVAYPLSFGPAYAFFAHTQRHDSPRWRSQVFWSIYEPIRWLRNNSPAPIRRSIDCSSDPWITSQPPLF